MNRIFNIISWLGIALVLAAVGIRFGVPAQERYATYLAWAGLACILLYAASTWRISSGWLSRPNRNCSAPGKWSGRDGSVTNWTT